MKESLFKTKTSIKAGKTFTISVDEVAGQDAAAAAPPPAAQQSLPAAAPQAATGASTQPMA